MRQYPTVATTSPGGTSGHVSNPVKTTRPIVDLHVVALADQPRRCIGWIDQDELITLQPALLRLVGVVCIQERMAFRCNDVQRVEFSEFGLISGAFEWPHIAGKRVNRLAALHLVVHLAKWWCDEIPRIFEENLALRRRRLEIALGMRCARISSAQV